MLTSPFTGIFTRIGSIAPRPHDPDVRVWSGSLAPLGPRAGELAVGGAGWDEESARGACLGEAVERLQPYPLPCDEIVEASAEDWPLAETAVGPGRWVLFHPDQHRQPGFPFEPFSPETRLPWARFRQAFTGAAHWIPADMAFLYPKGRHRLCAAVSTGMSSGRPGQPVLLRGAQEVVERDAVVGAWWGRYPLEEWTDSVLDPAWRRRLARPNLRYRFYRVDSPFSAHVTLVTVEGEDLEGHCLGVGTACRETRAASWEKSVLEAVHSFRYARHLKKDRSFRADPLLDFPQHALYYSLHPERVAETVLHRALPPAAPPSGPERLEDLVARLGPDRPVLFRLMTPPGIASEEGDWIVVRVVIPGLQPLHGNDSLAHLGGPLWAPRTLADWAAVPPHPFA